jgi:hypothetical protein
MLILYWPKNNRVVRLNLSKVIGLIQVKDVIHTPLNSDGQQFHQYQQNDQPADQILKHTKGHNIWR